MKKSMLPMLKKIMMVIIIVMVVITIIFGLRSYVLIKMGQKYGLHQYKVGFWDTNESFEYLANEVSKIFDESKREHPEIERIYLCPKSSNVLEILIFSNNDAVLREDLSISSKFVDHYNNVSQNFASREKSKGLSMIEAFDEYVVFMSYAPYAIIYHENGTMPKGFGPVKLDTFYAERISFRWFHGTNYELNRE